MTGTPGQGWTSGQLPTLSPDSALDMLAQAADLGLMIDPDGQIIGVICGAGFKSGDRIAEMEGRALRDTLTAESVEKFEARVTEFRTEGRLARPVELNHAAFESFEMMPVRYGFHAVGDDGGFLMLGRDLTPIADVQQQLVAAQITLEKDYEARRAFDTQFRVLMASVEDAMIFVSLPDGRVSDCNPAARALLGRQGGDLTGLGLEHLFEVVGKPGLTERLSVASQEGSVRHVTLKALSGGRMVTVVPTLFRAGGDQSLLCRVSSDVAAKPKSDTLGDNLAALYENGSDAILFISASGTILSANEAFLGLADITQGQVVKGRSLAEFLTRGGVDMSVLIENAARSGVMRAYTTKITGAYGSERPVEISTTALHTAGTERVFALVMRDVSRAEGARTETQQLGEVNAQSVIELIGNQPLRDIVASTTDVVERMCIETAVELTSNNRVAAAEMLGLSRQSLYVKLRKYGLLKTGTDG